MNYNAIVNVDVRQLAKPSAPFEAAKDGRFAALFHNVPDEVEILAVVIYTPAGAKYAPVNATQNGNGDWTVRLSGQFFPTAGDAKYEVVGQNAAGENVPICWGKLRIADFGSGTTVPTTNQPYAEIPDENGVMRKVVAIQDEVGAWTWKIIG